ncbi:MAG: dTDP-glucose 4,6-dehydratase [Muribaculaceae bacterium]
MKKTYLVTGGAGFIGANFVKYILRTHGSDAAVIVVDALTYAGNIDNISDEIADGSVVFIHANINDAEAMDKVFAEYNPDFVVNFAAETHVDRSITGPRIFAETNIMGTLTLLDTARRHWQAGDGTWSAGKKFLHISTDEVYGSLAREYDNPQPIAIPEELKPLVARRRDIPAAFGSGFFTEANPLKPRSPYSAAKASADMMVLAWNSTYGMPVNITRCSNNYGPMQFPEKLIPLLINNIQEGKALPVYGKGLNVRDWLFVDDHCSAIDAVLLNGRPGEVYNIGGFNEKANIDIVREVIELVAEMTGTEPRYDLISYVTDRPGHDMRYAIDPHKMASELGWVPLTTFADGIRKTVRWYLDNPDWVRKIVSGEYQEYYKKQYNR